MRFPMLSGIFGLIIGFIAFRYVDKLFPGLTNPPAALPTIIKRFA